MNFQNRIHSKIYNKIKSKKPMNYLGFSLIELIIVIAIMSVLLGLVSPAVMQYLRNNKKKACRQNREIILAMYQRCLYDSSNGSILELDLSKSSLEKIINPSAYGDVKSQFAQIEYEMNGTNSGQPTNVCTFSNKRFNEDNCWEWYVKDDSNTACIKCNKCGNTVSKDMVYWKDTVRNIQDSELPTPTPKKKKDPEDSGDDETPSPTPIPPKKYLPSTTWPYSDDDTWWDAEKIGAEHDGMYIPSQTSLNGTYNNQTIVLNSPSGIFESRDGGRFVYVESQPIKFEEAITPEYYSAIYPQRLVQLTGRVVKNYYSKANSGSFRVDDMLNGDLIEFIDDITDPGNPTTYTYVFWHTGQESHTINISDVDKYATRHPNNMYQVYPN